MNCFVTFTMGGTWSKWRKYNRRVVTRGAVTSRSHDRPPLRLTLLTNCGLIINSALCNVFIALPAVDRAGGTRPNRKVVLDFHIVSGGLPLHPSPAAPYLIFSLMARSLHPEGHSLRTPSILCQHRLRSLLVVIIIAC